MTPGRGYSAATLPAQFQDLLLPGSQQFKEDLYFGKLSWQPGDNHLVELTAINKWKGKLPRYNGTMPLNAAPDSSVAPAQSK